MKSTKIWRGVGRGNERKMAEPVGMERGSLCTIWCLVFGGIACSGSSMHGAKYCFRIEQLYSCSLFTSHYGLQFRNKNVKF